LIEIDRLTEQTSASILRLLGSMVGREGYGGLIDSTTEEAFSSKSQTTRTAPNRPQSRSNLPPLRSNIAVTSDRFFDRTIPQATTILLKETGGPLHVNEIYNLLVEGGFSFTGNHPTISIAVSLNRNGRFRKVSPGKFDLAMREVAQAV
jgi:hypothetical protein